MVARHGGVFKHFRIGVGDPRIVVVLAGFDKWATDGKLDPYVSEADFEYLTDRQM